MSDGKLLENCEPKGDRIALLEAPSNAIHLFGEHTYLLWAHFYSVVAPVGLWLLPVQLL